MGRRGNTGNIIERPGEPETRRWRDTEIALLPGGEELR
jgi:hypothetical protein